MLQSPKIEVLFGSTPCSTIRRLLGRVLRPSRTRASRWSPACSTTCVHTRITKMLHACCLYVDDLGGGCCGCYARWAGLDRQRLSRTARQAGRQHARVHPVRLLASQPRPKYPFDFKLQHAPSSADRFSVIKIPQQREFYYKDYQNAQWKLVSRQHPASCTAGA